MNLISKTTAAALLAISLGGTAWAVTPEEAKSRVSREASSRGLAAAEVSQAVATLDALVAQGVPVDKALAVVNAAINDGLRGEDLAAIARGTEQERKAGKAPADAADKGLSMARAKANENARLPNLRNEVASPARGAFGPSANPATVGGAGGAMIPGGIPAAGGGVPPGRP